MQDTFMGRLIQSGERSGHLQLDLIQLAGSQDFADLTQARPENSLVSAVSGGSPASLTRSLQCGKMIRHALPSKLPRKFCGRRNQAILKENSSGVKH
jgi:hypothetical protein